MSFFSKLKNRLFRSSSKISEGLDAIVEDGGEEENQTTELADVSKSVTNEDFRSDFNPKPEPEPQPEPEQEPEP